MDCAEIQELLSEYIDGTLDAKNVQAVEKHICVCEDCKETLASLSAMIEELNILEPMKAPADFLEKIHQRMEPRSDFRRFFRKLFVPFKIKIPLQLAAAVTASILVVMVLSLQKSDYPKMEPLKASKSEYFAEKKKTDHLKSEFKSKTKPPAPVLEEAPGRLSDSQQVMPAQRSRRKALVRPSIQRGSEPSSSVLAKVGSSAGKNQPIKIDLLLKPDDIGGAYAPGMAMQTTPLLKGDKKPIEKKRIDNNFLDGKIEAIQKKQADDLLLRINHIIRPLKGKILTKEYHKQKDRLTSIHVQIPVQNYVSFYKALNSLGTFKTPLPALSDESQKTVELLVNFTYPP